jgi:23S rRNA pseudouridine1911/1915/1917 synthase
MPELEILYERGAVFVFNKPGGLLTQGPPGVDSLEWRFRQFIKARLNPPGNVYVGVPHRLDRPVSGAIAMVRNVRAAQRISQQFEQRSVTKTYWALVEGRVEEDRQSWCDWMRKLPDEAKSEIVSAEHPDAKKAVLHFTVQSRSQNLSLLEIKLETGRTHQIRLQSSAHGHPIVGDFMYGSTIAFGKPSADTRKQSIALHARRLSFEHPIERCSVDVVAPFNRCWAQFDEFRGSLELQ